MEIIRSVSAVRGEICIELDNGEKYWLKKSDSPYGTWRAGMEVDTEELQHFVLLHQYPRALERAVSMLARRPCSKNEIRQKLSAARFSDETISMVLCKLEKERLVDDQAFSSQWAAYRSGQKYGANRISRELRWKGISEADAETALAQISEEDQLSGAVALVQKQLRRFAAGENAGLCPDEKEKQRIIGSLVRRGYRWETAKEAYRLALSTGNDE